MEGCKPRSREQGKVLESLQGRQEEVEALVVTSGCEVHGEGGIEKQKGGPIRPPQDKHYISC
jgi:hypothetical protein